MQKKKKQLTRYRCMSEKECNRLMNKRDKMQMWRKKKERERQRKKTREGKIKQLKDNLKIEFF